MSTTLDKVHDAFSGKYEDNSRGAYYALLWAYRGLIAEKLAAESELEKLKAMNAQYNMMLQEWILSHPSAEARNIEAKWKKAENGTV